LFRHKRARIVTDGMPSVGRQAGMPLIIGPLGRNRRASILA